MNRFIAVLLFAIASAGLAQSPESTPLEELLMEDIPNVVTAGRREQPIAEAAATISVITAEDIKQSGMINLPDILRIVPGVDVLATSSRNQQVSIRGFNNPLSNRLLVLIDGRSIQWDGYEWTFWDAIPIALEEIERIEIVRSPGSSLYGANAFCGVINIITKKPAQIKGTDVHVTGGTYDTYITSLMHAGEFSKLEYKVSGEWGTTNDWRAAEKSAGKIYRGNALVEYKLDDKVAFALSAGRGHNGGKKQFTQETLGSCNIEMDLDYMQLDANRGAVKFRTFMKREMCDMTWIRSNEPQSWKQMTYDAELLHAFQPIEKNMMTWGANFRNKEFFKNSWIPESKTQNLWSLFAEDEYKPLPALTVTLGARYDRHPLQKNRLSPRGNISYALVKDHTIRVSMGQAYRNPTDISNYVYIERIMSATTALPPPLPPVTVTFPYTYVITGNVNLKPEKITSYELGYAGTWSGRIRTNFNLFYNIYNDFIQTRFVNEITYYQVGDSAAWLQPIGTSVIPPGMGGIFPKHISQTDTNIGTARGIGGEISAEVLIRQGVTGFANYSYQQITDQAIEGLAGVDTIPKRIRTEFPKNKVNAGLRIKLKNGLSGNMTASWVAKMIWPIIDMAGGNYYAEVPDYTVVNGRLAYTFLKERAEVSATAYNMLKNAHYEYPVGINLPDFSSDQVGRRVTVQLSYKF